MAIKKEGKNLDFSDKYIRWFSELSNNDVLIAGGKGASLGEMYNHKFPVPPGFVITAEAFAFFISDIKNKIGEIMNDMDLEDPSDLDKKSKEIRALIEEQKMPEELKTEILESYHILSTEKIDEKGVSQSALHILRNSQEPIFVSVRSSATTEDLVDASFAGQQQSFLNVKGDFNLIEHVKKCFSSLYTARSMYYRKKKGFTEDQALLAAVVQKMVDSEKSGVVFSKNPVNLKDEVLMEAVFGLGEGIVSGMIHPDNYVVSGKTSDELDIKAVKTADKKIAIVRSGSGDNKVVKLSLEKSHEQVLTRGEVLEIANYALKLEDHYKKPQDIEFAIEAGKVYIVQSRPITTKGVKASAELSGNVLLEGLGASPGIGVGVVKIIKGMEDLSRIKKGDVLVTEMTDPDMVVSMQKSVAIITDEGGMTSHAAIVSREMGIPAVVGTGEATKLLKEGMRVTVDGTNGKVYEGEVAETKHSEVMPAVPTKGIHLKVIVDLPEFAERAAKSGITDIGLTRVEGMIASMGKHPEQYEKENDLEAYEKLLEDGIEKIIKPFKLMWIRSSDIRTDEYGSLKGAPEEETNPMMGLHGLRYSLLHPKIFEAELGAIKKVAERNPGKTLGVMFPQVTSLDEVQKARVIFNKFKLNNMQFGVMIETPAAVQIIEDICKEKIDFISFGTNDLTQFTLGVDRGEESIQFMYNEMHPGVLSQIKSVIDVCKRYGVESSICGQAGSNKEMVEKLVGFGIDSISLNADAAHDISIFINELEGKLEKKQQEVERGFDKRKQQGLVSKDEINEGRVMRMNNNGVYRGEEKESGEEEVEEIKPIIENENKKRFGDCESCGKQFRVRFRPKKGMPLYCKACYKSKVINNKDMKQEIGQISPLDNTSHLEEEIKDIQGEVKEANEERIQERRELEDNIETDVHEVTEEVKEDEKRENKNGVGDDFNLESELGVYNPDEKSSEEYDYNLDKKDSDVFSDVF